MKWHVQNQEGEKNAVDYKFYIKRVREQGFPVLFVCLFLFCFVLISFCFILFVYLLVCMFVCFYFCFVLFLLSFCFVLLSFFFFLFCFVLFCCCCCCCFFFFFHSWGKPYHHDFVLKVIIPGHHGHRPYRGKSNNIILRITLKLTVVIGPN